MKSAIKTCTCGARFIFLRNGDGWKPVNLETTRPGQDCFDPAAGHVSHFQTCPDRKQYQRKDGERAPVYDDEDLARYRSAAPAPAALDVPEGASAELIALYQRAGELGFDRPTARALLNHIGITGNPLAWDASTIDRAGAELERQAVLRDETTALLEDAGRTFERMAS